MSRALQMGVVAGQGGGGPTPLFTYDTLVGSRSSERAFWDPRTPGYEASGAGAWLANDVLSIDPVDGALLIEEARTNQCPDSQDLSTWSVGGGGSTTLVAGGGPDGSDAYDVEDDSSVGLEYLTRTTASLPVGTAVYTAHVEKGAGTKPGFQVRDNAGTLTGGTVNVHLDADTGATGVQSGSPTDIRVEDMGAFWRLTFKVDVATAGALELRLYGAFGTTLGTASATPTGAAVITDVQIESGEWPTSPIRTSGAAASRLAEYGVLPSASVPSTMLSGRWSFTWRPSCSKAELDAGGADAALFTFAGGVTTNRIVLAAGATNNLVIRSGGVTRITHAMTWNAGDEIAFTIDMAAGEVTIAGAATGNGTFAFASTGPFASGDVEVGGRSAIDNACKGVLGQVFAA